MSESVKSFETLIRKLKSKVFVFHEITEAAQQQKKAFRNKAHNIYVMKFIDEFSEAMNEVKFNIKILI